MDYLRLALIALIATGCRHVPEASDTKVMSLVQERIQKHVSWNPDPHTKALIASLLQQELSLDIAVQIALVNNPTIQQTFEELGIAEADLVQAGLLHNPIFEGFVRFPHANTEFSVVQNFIDVFLIPLKKKVAKTECELVQLQVAHHVVQVAFDVETAYYMLLAGYERQTLLQQIAEIAEIESEVAARQFEAGNINELKRQMHMGASAEIALQVQRGQLEVEQLQKDFSLLLGVQNRFWHIAKPKFEAAPLDVEREFIFSRFDLQAARLQVQKLAELGATKRWWTYTDGALGVSWENDIDGSKVFGPSFGCMLPFFNTGQADRARLYAELKQSEHRVRALELDILSHFELAKQKLQILTEQRAHRLVQIQEKAVQLSDTLYEVMGVGIYALLDSKKEQLSAKILYVDACRDYAIAKIELERACGRRLKP